MSDAVIAALEASLQSCSDPVPIRRHLASLLLAAGRPADALGHCQAILAIAPADIETMGLAADSALRAGNPTLADAYRSMAAAFTRGGTAPMATSPPWRPQTEHADHGHDSAPGGAVLPFHLVPGWDDPDAPERPSIRLEDVGGLDAVKQRLERSFLGPMRNPQLRARYGKSLRGGLLLWGPPGCGKTFIARATAGELGARFIGVGLPDILDMYFGNSDGNLHELFERTRRSAPCVVFLDELDALGAKRVNLRSQQTWRGLIAQLLSELDGALSDNEGVFMLGATNAPWDVDPALTRPGRFDRTLLVLPPDRPAREAILSFHLRERPITDLDLGRVAAETEGYSGADLAALAEGRQSRPWPIPSAQGRRARSPSTTLSQLSVTCVRAPAPGSRSRGNTPASPTRAAHTTTFSSTCSSSTWADPHRVRHRSGRGRVRTLAPAVDPVLYRLLVTRLTASPPRDAQAGHLILTACEGPAALDAALRDASPSLRVASPEPVTADGGRVFLDHATSRASAASGIGSRFPSRPSPA